MTIKVSVPNDPTDLKARIVVFGVGGAGGNAVNNMIRYNLEGVDCVVANTDAQALAQSLAERRVQLGRNITQGLGAGSRPDIGRAAAEEGMDEIREQLQGTHMAFITAGMGGGTGTGASPVIAKAAREEGILTVGVVTKPFHFEGERRMEVAETGLAELEQFVDTLIVIPNQNLFRVANENTTFADAFKMADDVLYAGVRGVTDLMVMPGLINLDFADIRTVMSEMGKAMMGAGEAEGADRAKEAAEAAISNPLLDDISMKGAHGVLINITGGQDMKLFEVDEAVNRIRDEVDAGANIIFGSTFDETLDGRMRVSIFATGIDAEPVAAPKPIKIQLVAKDGSRTAMPAAEPEPEPERVPGAAAATAAADSGHEVPREPQKGPEQMAPPREPAPRAPVPPTPAAIQAAARERVAAPPRPRPDADRAVPQERDAPARQPGDAVARPAPDVERRHPAARPADVAKPAPEAPAAAPEPRHPGLFGSVDDDPATSQASGSRADVVTTLEDHEPIASSQDDEALLEIPAFLRRQAN